MHRRHFVKLSATGVATLLLSRLTHAEGINHFINAPEEVWAQFGKEWIRLSASVASSFVYKDAEVGIKTNGNAKAVNIASPTLALTGVRLKWKHGLPSTAKVLGDHWE